MLALRYLVNAWREQKFVALTAKPAPLMCQTENKLLVEFDLSYRLRRLIFVRGKLDTLSNVDVGTATLVQTLLDWHKKSIEDGFGELSSATASSGTGSSRRDGRSRIRRSR